MAERRMFAKSIVLSDAFLDMPLSARCLYFTLGMFADDDGFVGSPKGVMRQCGASQDDMAVLIQKRFVLTFESGVIVIKHWKINNYLQKDRHKDTTYLEELATLDIDDKGAYTEKKWMYTKCIQNVYTGKNSIDKNRLDKIRIDKSITEALSDEDLDELDDRYEDIIRLIDFVDDKIHLSNRPVEIFNALAYVVAIAEKERWQTKSKHRA